MKARELAALALSLPAAAALPRLLGLAADDALAATVAVVPPVVAGLYAVEAATRRHGARAARPSSIALQATLLAAWLLLAAARARFALPLAPPLAAALFALLGLHVLDLLPRLRPLLGPARLPGPPRAVNGDAGGGPPGPPATTPPPRANLFAATSLPLTALPRLSAAFFFLPLLAYLAVLPWSTAQRPPDGDEPYYLLVAHSLAYDFDADLANNYAAGDSLRFLPRRLEPQPGDPVGPHGERYSRHNMLLPLLLALPYRLAGARGAAALMAVFAAALAWQTLRRARHLLPAHPGGSLLVWGLLAFAPPLLLYSHQVWVEVPAALLLGIGVDALWSSPDRRSRGIFWLAVALLPLLKLRFAAFAALLAALAWWRGGRRLRVLVGAATGLATLFAAILLFNEARFGSALKTYGLEQLLPEAGPATVLARALGLFFDAGFGLFAAAPLWLLLLPSWADALRRRERFAWETAFLTLPYLQLLANRREWYGGWSPPFRYGVAVLPLLALPLATLLDQRRSGGARLLVSLLATATGAVTLLWLAVPGWTYNFADGSTLLLTALGHDLALDVARLLPSAIRLRPAIWWWPLLTLAATLLLWRRPRRSRPGLAALGAAFALAMPAAALVAAARLPTRVVELEDGQVLAQGGTLYPSRWTFDRPRFRGGWKLIAPTRIAAPVVAGSRRVRLSLWAKTEGPRVTSASLLLAAGDHPLGRAEVPTGGEWRRFDLGPCEWTPGAPLVLTLPAGGGLVIVDRVELDWR